MNTIRYIWVENSNYSLGGQIIPVSGLSLKVTDYYVLSGKITTVPTVFSEHLFKNDKHQIMNVHELFDTHFVLFGQVLLASDLKISVKSSKLMVTYSYVLILQKLSPI